MENIYKETISSTDKRLNRHINHDERSKQFAFDTTNIVIKDVEHLDHIGILDQGEVGSCTGNAAIGAINTDPFLPYVNPIFQPNENGALALYSAAEMIDGDGPYPPNDHGSSGLSVAKALKNVGMIPGYQHTFTLQDALKALTQGPIFVGTNWYQDMFTPDADGRVHPTGKLAGGHEYRGFKIDIENGRIWFKNSWNTTWGLKGTFYLTWADFAVLLAKSGDVTVPLTPVNAPIPVPKHVPVVNTLTLTRSPDNGTETLGSFHAIRPDGKTLVEYTLELPWKDNQHDISCIPKGTYPCSLRPFHTITNYEVLNVPNRTGIFFHVANWVKELLGCIAPGVGEADINGDGQIDVTSSGIAVDTLKAFFNNEDFTLIIV